VFLRQRLGAGGQQRVREEFSLGQMADRFVRVCHDVVTPGSSRSMSRPRSGTAG
jgi:hypothetical protein